MSIPVDLHADGILWLINRCIFHPRGFALGHTPTTDQWVLIGDGSEPWHYAVPAELDDPTKAVDEDSAFAAVEAMFRRAFGGGS